MREITEAQRDLIKANGGNDEDVRAWQERAAEFDWEALREWADLKNAG